MPSKRKDFRSMKFRPEDLKEAAISLLNELPSEIDKSKVARSFSVSSGDTTWRFETEDEFYSEYRKASTTTSLFKLNSPGYVSLEVTYYGTHTAVDIALPSRPQIERVFEVFEKAKQYCFVPAKQPRPRVFIGHGRHSAWRDLSLSDGCRQFSCRKCLY